MKAADIKARITLLRIDFGKILDKANDKHKTAIKKACELHEQRIKNLRSYCKHQWCKWHGNGYELPQSRECKVCGAEEEK